MEIDDDNIFRTYVVILILNGKVEKAVEELSKRYGAESPRIKVSRVGGIARCMVYSAREKTIYIQEPKHYSDSFLILHE